MKKMRLFAFLLVLILLNAMTVVAEDNITAPSITVRFSPSPGNLPDGVSVYTGNFGMRIDNFPEPEPPRGYFFIGWFVGGVHITPPIAVTRSTTILAGFAPFHDPDDSAGFVIVYDPGIGKLPSYAPPIRSFTYGSAITSLPTPTHDEYVFAGWLNDDEILLLPHIVQNDMVLEAAWVADSGVSLPSVIEIPPRQNIAVFNPFPGFFANNETGIILGGSSIFNIPDAPTRNGLVFEGWRLPDGSILEDRLPLVDGDIKLTAIWASDTSDTPVTTVDIRPNPPTSPITLNLVLFGAIILLVSTVFGIFSHSRRQNKEASKQYADKMRLIREARILMKNQKTV